MPGTKAGAAKATATLLARDPDFFRKAGSKGGSKRVPKGFALMSTEDHAAASRKGGRNGKRGPAVKKEEPKRHWWSFGR